MKIRVEQAKRSEDIDLVRRLEDIELSFAWERSVLEEVSQRVYALERALLPRQRDAINEILDRREERPDDPD